MYSIIISSEFDSSYQNMLNNLTSTSEGYLTVTRALASMTKVAQHINEMKRKHENAVRIQEIASLLHDWDGDDLTTFGDLVLEVSCKPTVKVLREAHTTSTENQTCNMAPGHQNGWIGKLVWHFDVLLLGILQYCSSGGFSFHIWQCKL